MGGVFENIGRANVLTFEVEMEGVKIVVNESTSSTIVPRKGAYCIDGS